MQTLWRLFYTFVKIGLFTFGGGYAMLALLEDEFVTRRSFLSQEEFLDMVALAESTPGPIAINAATYIGHKAAGIAGSTVATVAVCLPSFVILYVISLFFDAFLAISIVQKAFAGIKVCVVWLIGSAGWRLAKELPRRPLSLFIAVTVGLSMIAVSLFGRSFSSLWYILASGALGILFAVLTGRRKEDDR